MKKLMLFMIVFVMSTAICNADTKVVFKGDTNYYFTTPQWILPASIPGYAVTISSTIKWTDPTAGIAICEATGLIGSGTDPYTYKKVMVPYGGEISLTMTGFAPYPINTIRLNCVKNSRNPENVRASMIAIGATTVNRLK